MNELKKLGDYHEFKRIIQSNLSYGEKIKELKSYATDYYSKLAIKHFKEITLDY